MKRERLDKVIRGPLTSCLNDHGPITEHLLGSATKRVASQVDSACGWTAPSTTAQEPVTLTCDMQSDCPKPVTHIDDNGFAYCTTHGIERRYWRPCRKLRPHELRRLQRGEQLSRY